MTIQDKIYNYFNCNSRLHVLFIFDEKILGGLADELESLTWKEGYRYEVFDGRYFTTKYKIAHEWKDEKVILLFPGMSDQSSAAAMGTFALSGEMSANMVFHNESYLAFMQQHNIPESFATLIESHISDLQLGKMEKIMSGYYAPGMFSADVCHRGLLSLFLKQDRVIEWSDILIRVVILFGQESEKAKRDYFVRSLGANTDTGKALSDRFESSLGRPINLNKLDNIKEAVESFKYNAITQNLEAIPADDYRAYKKTTSAFLQNLNNFIAAYLQHPLKTKFFESVSSIAEGIRESQIIKWYGADADYALITDSLCGPIIEYYATEQIVTNPAASNMKLRRLSLKFDECSPLRACIDFLTKVCLVCSRIKDFGTFQLNTVEDYIFRYKSEFYLIDMAYRQAVKSFYDISMSGILPSLLDFEALRSLKADCDRDYAKAVNELNFGWMKCVNDSGVPLVKLQSIKHQHSFYKDNVESSGTKVTVIVSDAFRYEVAAELMQEFGGTIHTASLDIAMATVPTETKYCKDALLPHKDLSLKGDRLLLDGKEIKGTADRDAQLKSFNSDGICIQYEDFMKLSALEKRDLCKRSTVYMFHNTIDSMSHKNPAQLGLACEVAKKELKELIGSLHSSQNVTNVILTADHGFLYNDMPFADKDKHRISEDTVELKTRYYLSESGAEAAVPGFGISKFPVSDVSGMRGDCFVAVPNGANRLYAAGGGYEFAHGGASLQELIIPVLFSYRQRVDKKLKVDVKLLETRLVILSSQMNATLIQVQAVSAEFKERRIVYGLYLGDVAVSQERVLTLDSTDAADIYNRLFKVNLIVSKPVSAAILEFRVYDQDDRMNPLVKFKVLNKTLIEQDF